MGRNKLRLSAPVNPPLRIKNSNAVAADLSSGNRVTEFKDSNITQQSKTAIEGRIFLSKMRAKVALTIGNRASKKQPNDRKAKKTIAETPGTRSNTTDVFDREKLKNLLNVVSQTVTQRTTNINKSESIDSGNGSAITTQAGSSNQRKRKCSILQVEDESKSGQSKRKKSRVSKSSNDDTKGVDVNKLKRLLKEVTQHKSGTESSSPSLESSKKAVRNGKGQLSLKERMVARLNAARFRYINEQLYSVTGDDAKKFFAEEPDAFQLYHDGFRKQAQKWPINPLDVIVRDILAKSPSLIVADFGCGDAQLASNVPNTVHSYDLVAVNEQVIECDMSKVPLKNKTVDIVVFCLSLMGTNSADYLKEANRVLKDGGELKIAEIESRISNIKAFNRTLKALGFSLAKQKSDEKMFIFMDFIKKKNCPPNKQVKLVLQPCVYKKR
ncbi:hypothetical protein CHUAL_011875 [Chamberlinius hualienensis]